MSTPAALYRNAIDLNRYSNSVARRVINAYNDIIIDADAHVIIVRDARTVIIFIGIFLGVCHFRHPDAAVGINA